MSGLYVIFEGNDGAGKTTTMTAVAEEMKRRYPNFDPILTHHPGSTPLGSYLRKLVKFPEQIDPNIRIDDLSRQMLYMVDTVSFIRTLLEPALEQNKAIFADRSSFISALVYGLADGLSLHDITRLFDIITPPKANRLYVLQCPWLVGKQRIQADRGTLDHYDRKPAEFFNKIEQLYQNLITGPSDRTILITRSVALDDIVYIDTTMPRDRVIKTIADDLSRLIQELGVLPPTE